MCNSFLHLHNLLLVPGRHGPWHPGWRRGSRGKGSLGQRLWWGGGRGAGPPSCPAHWSWDNKGVKCTCSTPVQVGVVKIYLNCTYSGGSSAQHTFTAPVQVVVVPNSPALYLSRRRKCTLHCPSTCPTRWSLQYTGSVPVQVVVLPISHILYLSIWWFCTIPLNCTCPGASSAQFNCTVPVQVVVVHNTPALYLSRWAIHNTYVYLCMW